jgi:hypothetical protein
MSRRAVPEEGNFLPTPGFAQLWGNGVWKWLLCADFRASTGIVDELQMIENPAVDARECGGYSVNPDPNLQRVGASAASGAL